VCQLTAKVTVEKYGLRDHARHNTVSNQSCDSKPGIYILGVCGRLFTRLLSQRRHGDTMRKEGGQTPKLHIRRRRSLEAFFELAPKNTF
jgi:hypothetical protein